MKQTKQWVFSGLTLGASVLILLTVVFKVLPLVFVFVAAALCIAVVIVGVNILFGDASSARHENSSK
jgi:multisubunit Na+/H+ antiporter MnhB subunit